MPKFEINPAYKPVADQPVAMAGLAEGIEGGDRFQTLLGRPSLLVLDEATCSLDAVLEQRVIANLSSVPSTSVSVAHRQPIIANASRVFSVTGGSVAEVVCERSRHPRAVITRLGLAPLFLTHGRIPRSYAVRLCSVRH